MDILSENDINKLLYYQSLKGFESDADDERQAVKRN